MSEFIWKIIKVIVLRLKNSFIKLMYYLYSLHFRCHKNHHMKPMILPTAQHWVKNLYFIRRWFLYQKNIVCRSYRSINLKNFLSLVFFYLVALSNLNQPILSDTSATVMVKNTLQPLNDYPIQEGNILNGPLAASTNCNLINPQNKADTGRSKSG